MELNVLHALVFVRNCNDRRNEVSVVVTVDIDEPIAGSDGLRNLPSYEGKFLLPNFLFLSLTLGSDFFLGRFNDRKRGLILFPPHDKSPQNQIQVWHRRDYTTYLFL